MERRWRSHNSIGTSPLELGRVLRLQTLKSGLPSSSSSDRIRTTPQLTSTTLRQCIREAVNEDACELSKTEPLSSRVHVSLPLEIQFMILEEADAKYHGTLARVCKVWHTILQTSRIAQAKRYLEYSVDFAVDSNSSTSNRSKLDFPTKIKIHRMIRMNFGHSQQYLFKDGYSVQENQPGGDNYRFRVKGSYPGLNVFTEDPIFIFPDNDSTVGNKGKGNQGPNIKSNSNKEISDPSIKEPSGSADGPLITLSQVFFYKYQTSGLFPSLLGSGLHLPLEDIIFTKSSKISFYTDTIITRLKEIAELARAKRCAELTKSTKDKQIIALWERLSVTDGEFVFQVHNHEPLYKGHRLTLTINDDHEFDPCDAAGNINEFLFDKEPNFLDLIRGLPPSSRPFTRHPFSDSEDDS